MDGEPIHISGLPVASPLVNIPAHVEMDGIAAGLTLLAHVLQLHVWQMDWGEVPKDLMSEKGKKGQNGGICQKKIIERVGGFLTLTFHLKKKSNKTPKHPASEVQLSFKP